MTGTVSIHQTYLFKTLPNIKLLNDEILTIVNKCKYLGHVFTEYLSDDDDMAGQYKR